MTIKFFNDPQRLWKLLNLMLEGAGVTLSIFFLTLVFSVPLGMLVAPTARERKTIIPDGNTSIHVGDRVIVMAKTFFLHELDDILA